MKNIEYGSDPRAHHAEATKTIDRDTAQFTGRETGMVSAEDILDAFTAPLKNSKHWDAREITWGEFLEWLKTPANEKECGQYVFGRFEGRVRKKDTVKDRCAIALDADYPKKDFLDRLRAALGGHAAVVHTTYSSTAEEPRYRVIIPLAEPVSPKDYRAATGELMRRIEDGKEFDKGSSQPERFMYKPSVQPKQEFWYEIHEGTPLDAAPLAEAAVEAHQEADAAPSPGYLDGPADAKAYFRAAVSRQADWLAFHSEGDRNTELNRSAFKAGQKAHLWPADDTEDPEEIAREELRYACGINGLLDDPEGEEEFAGTFSRGWNAGRGNPVEVKPASVATPTGGWGPDDRNTSGQLRMAHRLLHAYRSELMYVHGIGWHHWVGTHWAEDRDGAAMRAVDDLLRRSWADSYGDKDLTRDVRACQSGSAMKGILSIAQTLDGITATVDQVDADPYLLNVANGALDLHTMELRAHRPEDRCTKIARGSYDPAALGHNWERLLTSSLPDEEVRGFLQRYVGQALVGRVLEQKLLFLQGEGSNGKSVWAEAIANALGDYAITPQAGMLLASKHRSAFDGSVELRGRRWAVLSEVEKGRELAPATVKQLTGSDRIRARNLYEKNVEFSPSHSLAMLVNDLPRVTDKTTGMWRRLRVVHWGIVIPKEQQDVSLGEKLELEADAVLTWAAAGWYDYQERNGLDEPEQVRVATDAYRTDNDDIRRFLDDRTEPARGQSVKPSDLYDAYMEWVEDNRIRHSLGTKTFSQEVAEVPGMERGGRNKHWVNLRLRQPEMEEDFFDLL